MPEIQFRKGVKEIKDVQKKTDALFGGDYGESRLTALQESNKIKDGLIDSLLSDRVDLRNEIERYERIVHMLIMKYQEFQDGG